MMFTRDFLNKLKWDPKYKGKENEFFIQYTHRGAPNDYIIICYSQITEIHSDSFEIHNETLNESLRIPFHRIEKIFNNLTHEVVYEKRIRV